jgi:hypothetical protein
MMTTTAPGANNEKALHWVQSHEGMEDAEIKWYAWGGYYIETPAGHLSEDAFMAMATRCFDLFATPLWSSEWSD